jgi:PBP1b-binding outer membrane lipoprotein LpoB
MKKIAVLAMSAAAALTLAGCGKSDSAKDGAEADNVEMPAEEAVTDVDATPAADASAEPGADAAAPAPATT